ncbi:MAG: hypothetical protein V4526_01345 [Patescibacteria group bacterium]
MTPFVLNAAELRFDISRKEISKQQEFAIDLLLDTKGETINAIEGEVVYPEGALQLVAVHDGNSIVPLWVQKAEDNNGRIAFSGIIPGGFKGLVDPLSYPSLYPGAVFKLIFRGTEKGIGEIKLENVRLLRSDGHGSEVSVEIYPVLVSVSSYTLNQPYELNDSVAPEFQIAAFEPKGGVFVDSPALVFLASDKESGVKEYQVKIEDGSWIVAESPYATDNYFVSKKFNIKAIDYSGNEKITEVTSPSAITGKDQVVAIVVLLALLILCGFIVKKVLRNIS